MCVTNRKIPVLGVTIFSAITLILSLVMVGFAVRFNNSGFSKDLGEFDDYTNEAFVILFAASLIAFVASVCGLTLFCVNKKVLTILFGCVLLPAASLVFLFGFSIATISNTDESTLRQFCSDDPNYQAEKDSKYINSARTSVADLDETMGNFVSTQMCSNTCPCNIVDDPSVGESWSSMSESDLNKYNRTKYSDANYIPLLFLSQSAGSRSYDTFKDCFEDIKSGKVVSSQQIKDAYNQISKDPKF